MYKVQGVIPGTMILTEFGYQPIERIREGTLVYTKNGTWNPVEKIWNHPAEIVTAAASNTLLKMSRQQFIMSTVFLPPSKGLPRRLSNQRNWIPALESGDKLCASPSMQVSMPMTDYVPPITKHIDATQAELFTFLALWVLFGKPNKNSGVITFAVSTPHQEEQVLACIEKITKHYEVDFKKTHKEISIVKEKDLAEWLVDNFGPDKKKFPIYLLTIHASLMEAFLVPFTKNMVFNKTIEREEIVFSSEEMAWGTMLMADIVGYSVRLFKMTPQKSRVMFLPFTSGGVLSRDDDYIWHWIRNTEKSNGVSEVYGLTVQNDNSYLANNMVVCGIGELPWEKN